MKSVCLCVCTGGHLLSFNLFLRKFGGETSVVKEWCHSYCLGERGGEMLQGILMGLSLLFCPSAMSDSLRSHGLQHTRLSLSFYISQSLLKLMSIESLMPSNHLILCYPLSLLPSIFPSIREWVSSSNQVAKVLELQLSISPSSENSGLIFFRIDQFGLLGVQGPPTVSYSNTVWKHQFFSAQPFLWSNSHICKWLLEKL